MLGHERNGRSRDLHNTSDIRDRSVVPADTPTHSLTKLSVASP